MIDKRDTQQILGCLMRAAAERRKTVVKKKEIKPRKFEVDFSQLDRLEDEE